MVISFVRCRVLWNIVIILTSDKVYQMIQDNDARESEYLANFSDREYKL